MTDPAPEPAADATNPLDLLPDAGDAMPTFEDAFEEAFAKLTAATADEPAADEPASSVPTDTDGSAAAADPDAPVEPVSDADDLESLSDELDDSWTPKAARRFKQLKAELKADRTELEQLRQAKLQYEAQIKELTGKVEDNSAEALQAKLAEFEQKQMLTDLEATTAYKTAVAEPLQKILEQVEVLADKYEVPSDALVEAMSMTDQAKQDERLAELLPDATDRDKAKLFRLIEDVDPIMKRRDELQANAKQALAEAQQLEEQKSAAEAAQRARVRENVTRNVVERIQQKLPFLKTVDGLDMASIEKAAAAVDPTTVHPVDHAFSVVSAKLMPTLVKQYVAAQREIEQLTARLAEFDSAEPSFSGRGGEGPPSYSEAASFEERIAAKLGG